jgi:hypothetical protein
MKKIICYILLPFFTLVFADFQLGYYLDYLYQKNKCSFNEGGLNDYLNEKSPDTLIIGSSRVIHMIIPDSIGNNVRNLGQQQKNLYYHHSVISILNEYGKLPSKMIILNIELSDLFDENDQRLLNQVRSLSFFYHRNNTVKYYINKSGPYEHLKHFSHLYRHNGNGILLVTNPPQNICPQSGNKGYLPLFRGSLDSTRIFEGIKQDSSMYNFNKINPYFFRCIREIKNICSKNDIKLVTLNAPYFRPYSVMNRYTKIMSKIMTDEGIEYIDFVGIPDSMLSNQELWFDHIHLNHEGAKLYSKIFRDRLKKPATKYSRIVDIR